MQITVCVDIFRLSFLTLWTSLNRVLWYFVDSFENVLCAFDFIFSLSDLCEDCHDSFSFRILAGEACRLALISIEHLSSRLPMKLWRAIGRQREAGFDMVFQRLVLTNEVLPSAYCIKNLILYMHHIFEVDHSFDDFPSFTALPLSTWKPYPAPWEVARTA